jgi:dolichol kinase
MGQPWADDVSVDQWVFIVGYPFLWVAVIYVFLNFVLDPLQERLYGTPQKSQYSAIKDDKGEDTAITISTSTSYGSTPTAYDPTAGTHPLNSVHNTPRVEGTPTVDILEDKYIGIAPTPSTMEAGQQTTPRLSEGDETKHVVLEEGESAGNYDAPWEKTFDFQFLVLMVLSFTVLIMVTMILHMEYFAEPMFWAHEVAKFATMVAVSLFGGLVCRRYCPVDDKGYIITSKSSWFKVNYTRKLQHFAAYMIPLVLKSRFHNTLSLAWGDFFTLLAFFVLIKPIREYSTFFMLQFNSLDRPEDRPHTLDWIIMGNIAPGFVIILFFKWLLGLDGNGDLVTIIVYITGIGDGLAEPVGIYLGKHKYNAMSCAEGRTYQRSWEGSACVFMSGMVFPAIQYNCFDSFNQLVAAMVALPPIVTYLEATAPHTMDSPVLMFGSGTVLLVILYTL